jgi:hypothetical protein
LKSSRIRNRSKKLATARISKTIDNTQEGIDKADETIEKDDGIIVILTKKHGKKPSKIKQNCLGTENREGLSEDIEPIDKVAEAVKGQPIFHQPQPEARATTPSPRRQDDYLQSTVRSP